jgi:hypothetical protein
MATSTVATVEGTNDPNSTKVNPNTGGRVPRNMSSGAHTNQAAMYVSTKKQAKGCRCAKRGGRDCAGLDGRIDISTHQLESAQLDRFHTWHHVGCCR